MPQPLFKVDLKKPMDQQALPGHNRWHPDIPPVVEVSPGDVFRIECLDWTDGQISDDNSANDVRDVKLPRVHVLSGPIAVKGAQPGDILVVDLLDVGALPQSEWGFTGIFARENGGGFLVDHFPDPHKAIWNFEGLYARSRHVSGVRFPGIIHPGLIGCAPSRELLMEWNRREQKLFDTNPGRVPPLCALPNPDLSCLGMFEAGNGPEHSGLAAPAGAQDGQGRALVDVEGKVVERRRRAGRRRGCRPAARP